jgi:para-aminobenzoate synthetase/4-amino-4-deoxychorismate lyase
MHVISELEATGREAYTGAIGYASPLAGLELNVAIRTFEARDGRLWLGAGGGIVADSNPTAELEECLIKARPLVAAAGGVVEVSGGEATAPRNAASALARGRWRPDPARGVFETILVRDGRPVNLAAHLERLGAGPPLPALHGDGALRLTATTAEFRPLDPRPLPIVLTPYLLPGGLGARKWRDRGLLDALSEDGTTPLLVDADGSVLEAAWAALLIRRHDTLFTPREDGRILPSTSRPAATQTRLTLEDLERADEILLSSSLAGLVPAVLR